MQEKFSREKVTLEIITGNRFCGWQVLKNFSGGIVDFDKFYPFFNNWENSAFCRKNISEIENC